MIGSSQSENAIREQYERYGYCIFRAVIDDALLQEVKSHVDWLMAKNPGRRPEQFDCDLITNDPFWVRLVSDARLLDLARQFIGQNIALYASHYIAKPPYDGKAVLWHQDGTYWPLEPMEVVSLFLAIDDADAENGCLRVIPGSQTSRLLNLSEMQTRTDVDNVLGTAMDRTLVDESSALDIVLKAGDVEAHHPNIIHGSNANTSARWRRGLTIRYIPTSTRILDTEPCSAFLLRGNAVSGTNAYQPLPKFVGGEHMPFRGWVEWNARCDEWNARI